METDQSETFPAKTPKEWLAEMRSALDAMGPSVPRQEGEPWSGRDLAYEFVADLERRQ